jgi:hypothetical protein
MDLENAAKLDASGIVQELNISMTWVRYPGCRNGTATDEEVDLATPGGSRWLEHHIQG